MTCNSKSMGSGVTFARRPSPQPEDRIEFQCGPRSAIDAGAAQRTTSTPRLPKAVAVRRRGRTTSVADATGARTARFHGGGGGPLRLFQVGLFGFLSCR